MNQNILNGFLKRASQYNVSVDDAISLLQKYADLFTGEGINLPPVQLPPIPQPPASSVPPVASAAPSTPSFGESLSQLGKAFKGVGNAGMNAIDSGYNAAGETLSPMFRPVETAKEKLQSMGESGGPITRAVTEATLGKSTDLGNAQLLANKANKQLVADAELGRSAKGGFNDLTDQVSKLRELADVAQQKIQQQQFGLDQRQNMLGQKDEQITGLTSDVENAKNKADLMKILGITLGGAGALGGFGAGSLAFGGNSNKKRKQQEEAIG